MDLKQHIKNILKEETNESLLDDLGNFFRPKKRVEVDPSTIQSEKEKFTCEDCGDPNYQMYMVDDDIWREYGNNTNTLCMSCLEKRMGRKLTRHDFSQHRSAPVNKHNVEVQDILTESVEEHVSDLKKPFMRYEKLINKLVYDVFDEGICGLSWDVIELRTRKGIFIRIILHFTYDSLKEFGYERYGQSKQELKVLIEDFLPKFDGIHITYDTTQCNETHKEEENEGVGGYAAPAFEMKPDHVHFKHLYNESEVKKSKYKNIIKDLIEPIKDEKTVCDVKVDYDKDGEKYDIEIIFDTNPELYQNKHFVKDKRGIRHFKDHRNMMKKKLLEDLKEYLPIKNVSVKLSTTDECKDEMNESELKERCWKGYTQKGMKTMFGKRYPNCVKIKKKKTIKESIRNILLQEVNKKYSKPTEKVDKLVYRWLDDYFEGSKIYKHESWKHWSFRFEFCKNGREIADLHLDFDDRSPDWGPRDKRPTSERSFNEAWLYIYPVMINELLTDIPIRKNYLLYLIEEWFEDTKLNEIQQGFNRSDMSLEYVYVSETKKKGELCVPPVTKPEDVTMQEMMDYIKKTTLYSYKDIEKNEEEEPGWVEELYLAKLRGKEQERLNQEDRENNPEPFNDDY